MIYDVLGNEVKSLVNNNAQAGYHSVIWNGTNNAGEKVSSGVYFFRVVTNSNSIVKKMLLI
jgi:flagellar hook assembly protein FlgD